MLHEWHTETHDLTIQTTQGTWTAIVYKPFWMGPEENEGDEIYENAALEERVNESSEDEANEDVQAPDFLIGANIKLLFSPSNQLEDTTSIRLIQFKKPINKDKGSTEEGWAVDACGGDVFPYFGWGNDNKARYLDNEYEAKMKRHARPIKKGPGAYKNKCNIDVDVWRLHDIPARSKNGLLVRGTLAELKGEKLAQEGKKFSSGSEPAFIVDTPREPCRVGNAEALFTTYAYDLTNNKWLGGVSWGYILSVGTDNKSHTKLRTLKKRSGGGPLKDEEAKTREIWKTADGAPSNRVGVPP